MKTFLVMLVLTGIAVSGLTVGTAEVSGCDPFCGN